MTFKDEELVSFYEDGTTAHRQLYTPREVLWEKLQWSGWSISLLIIIATVLYRLYLQDKTLDTVVTTIGHLILEALVYIIPARVIFALDSWMSPSQAMKGSNTHGDKRDAMCRIMGVDRPEGLMATVFQARDRALSGSVFGLKTQSDRPPGLGNIDNSCYQNSILQGLSSLDSLPEFLSKCLENMKTRRLENSVAQTLKTLMSDLNDYSNNGQTLWTPRVLKSMSSWTQQDAQEYYSKILDDIEKGVVKAVQNARPQHGLESDAASPNDTTASQCSDDSGYQSVTSESRLSDMRLIRNPLEGLLAQRVACIRCGYSDGISMIPFNCITLSLGLDKFQHDVYERLDSFTKVEAIEGVECPKCTLLKTQTLLQALIENMRQNNMSESQLYDQTQRLEAVELALEEDDFDEKTLHGVCKLSPKSKVTTTKTKQIVIARPPQSLVLHINRSSFDPMTFDMVKNSAPVHFPMTLDLGPWCLGSSDGKAANAEGKEMWPTESMTSLIAGDVSPSRLSGPIYELRAAVTHYGRHENGHYICYRKIPMAQQQKGAVSSQRDEVSQSTDAAKEQKEKVKSAINQNHEPVDASDESDEEACYYVRAKSDTKEAGGEVDSDAEKLRAGGTPNGSGWWRLSDHNVSRVGEETVMSLSPGVFMLFYECVDPSMIVDGEKEEMQDAESKLATKANVDVSRAEMLAGSHRAEDDAATTSAASIAATETDTEADSGSSGTGSDATTISTTESISVSRADSEEEEKEGSIGP